MDKEVALEYARLRRKGWSGRAALRAAKVNVEFEKYKGAGFVRFEVHSDECFELDWDFESEHEERRVRKRWGRDGAWGISVSARSPLGGPWVELDSVWGFIGSDYEDSGYDSEFKETAIEWLDSFEVAA